MKTTKSFLTITCLLGLAAMSVQSSSGASAPSNLSLTNSITDVSNVLWDVSLLTNELQNLDLRLPTKDTNTVEIIWADPFTQDGRGKLAGSGTNVEVTLILDHDSGSSTNTFTGRYSSIGSITSAKGVAHVTFAARVSGKMVFPGDSSPTTLTASGVYTAVLNAISNTVTGHSSEHASASGKSASKSKNFDPIALSDLALELGDGSWTLAIEFGTAMGNKLSGQAWVTLNSGQVYPYTFAGVYNPNNDQSKLVLKGYDAGKGSVLAVTLAGTELSTVTGRVSGQLVNIK